MLTRITSVLTGCAAGIGAIFLIQLISNSMYPLPEGMDPANAETMKAYVSTLPTGAFVMLVISYFTGALVAGAVATLIAKEAHLVCTMMAAGILALLGIINFVTIPHPIWVSVVSTLSYFVGAFIGHKIIMSFRKKNA